MSASGRSDNPLYDMYKLELDKLCEADPEQRENLQAVFIGQIAMNAPVITVVSAMTQMKLYMDDHLETRAAAHAEAVQAAARRVS